MVSEDNDHYYVLCLLVYSDLLDTQHEIECGVLAPHIPLCTTTFWNHIVTLGHGAQRS